MNKQYNQTMKTDNKLSIPNFNSRSLYANFSNIKDYLSKFAKSFKIIAIFETWINADRGMDFELVGYELNNINRKKEKSEEVWLHMWTKA